MELKTVDQSMLCRAVLMHKTQGTVASADRCLSVDCVF